MSVSVLVVRVGTGISLHCPGDLCVHVVPDLVHVVTAVGLALRLPCRLLESCLPLFLLQPSGQETVCDSIPSSISRDSSCRVISFDLKGHHRSMG